MLYTKASKSAIEISIRLLLVYKFYNIVKFRTIFSKLLKSFEFLGLIYQYA